MRIRSLIVALALLGFYTAPVHVSEASAGAGISVGAGPSMLRALHGEIVGTPAKKGKGSPLRTEVVNGTVTYTIQVGGKTYTNPVRRATVYLEDTQKGATGCRSSFLGPCNLRGGRTSDTGEYRLKVPSSRFPRALQVWVVPTLGFDAAHYVGVYPTDNPLGDDYHVDKTVRGKAVTETVNLDIQAGTSPAGTAFAILDSARLGVTWASLHGFALHTRIVFPVTTPLGLSDTRPDGSVVEITAQDGLETDVINHELGHVLEAENGFAQSPGGEHLWNADLSEPNTIFSSYGKGKAAGTTVAWNEAFASFFGVAVRFELSPAELPNRPGLAGSGFNYVSTPTFVSFATNDGRPLLGEANEMSIARVLWGIRTGVRIDGTSPTGVSSMDLAAMAHAFQSGTRVSLVAHIVTAMNSLSFDSSQGSVENTDAFGCLLAENNIGPKVHADTFPSPIPAEQPPTFSWDTGGARYYPLDHFDVYIVDDQWKTIAQEEDVQPAPGTTKEVFMWKPDVNGKLWKDVLAHVDSTGRTPTLRLEVQGTGKDGDVITGPYPGCGITIGRVQVTPRILSLTYSASNGSLTEVQNGHTMTLSPMNWSVDYGPPDGWLAGFSLVPPDAMIPLEYSQISGAVGGPASAASQSFSGSVTANGPAGCTNASIVPHGFLARWQLASVMKSNAGRAFVIYMTAFPEIITGQGGGYSCWSDFSQVCPPGIASVDDEYSCERFMAAAAQVTLYYAPQCGEHDVTFTNVQPIRSTVSAGSGTMTQSFSATVTARVIGLSQSPPSPGSSGC